MRPSLVIFLQHTHTYTHYLPRHPFPVPQRHSLQMSDAYRSYATGHPQRVERPFTRRLYALGWSTDGTVLATADDAVKDGEAEPDNVVRTYQASADSVRSCAASPSCLNPPHKAQVARPFLVRRSVGALRFSAATQRLSPPLHGANTTRASWQRAPRTAPCGCGICGRERTSA